MEYILKNVMETLVLQKMDITIDRLGCCKCEKCRMDIAAYALNHLPPKYFSTLKGELFMKVDALSLQHSADVISAITAGVQQVLDHPRH